MKAKKWQGRGLPASVAAHKINEGAEPYRLLGVVGLGRMERKMAVSEEWIKNRAYALWEEEGRPQGKHAEHWGQARQEYSSRNGSGVTTGPDHKDIAAEPAPTDPVIDTAPAKSAGASAGKPKIAPKAAAVGKPNDGSASKKRPARKASTT
jgi:hypothetical protein